MGKPVPEDTDVFTLADWQESVRMGLFNEHDGSGCFVANGHFVTDFIFDDVFGPVPDGATHVAWFNK